MMKKAYTILMMILRSLNIKSNRITLMFLMISRFLNTGPKHSLLMSLYQFKILRKYSAVLSNYRSLLGFM